jgi:peptidyl-dipeptidase A
MARRKPARLCITILAGLLGLLVVGVGGCWTPGSGDVVFRAEVRAYLARYETTYHGLVTDAEEARWAFRTRIVPGDDRTAKRARSALEALATFTGSVENIALARAYWRRRQELTPALQKELEAILYRAGGNPQTVSDLVHQRIAAETEEIARLDEFEPSLDGRALPSREIERCLRTETDLPRRQAAWEASKAIGPTLRDGLVRLRGLRNDTVRALGHKSLLDYRAQEYGWRAAELAQKMDEIERDLRPLLIELHTWVRYELARRYDEPVPDLIPAHWLPSLFGERWDTFFQPPGFDLNATFSSKTPRWMVEEAERTWLGLGFEKLPASFWENSSLLAPDAPGVPGSPGAPDASGREGGRKSRRASAWHIDLDSDVRLLTDVEPSIMALDAYEELHADLGQLFYALAAANPRVPYVLRTGANRAFPLALGATVGFAARQPAFLKSAGTWTGAPPDAMQLSLAQALEYVPLVAWSAGTLFRFEEELYRGDLPPDRWNQHFWSQSRLHQGIAPPFPRDERWCDACAVERVIDEPAASFDDAIAIVMLFQLHDHIARKILDVDPHDADYHGRRDVGDFLKSIMKTGATRDWRPLLLEKTGYDLSARAMADYFKPLRKWLAEQNKGRKSTLMPL